MRVELTILSNTHALYLVSGPRQCRYSCHENEVAGETIVSQRGAGELEG